MSFFSTAAAPIEIYTLSLHDALPISLEFMERDAILASQKFLDNYALELPDEIQAHLLIEVNGNDQKILMREIEGMVSVLEQFKTGEILFADTEKAKEDLWRLDRKSVV